MFFEKLGFSSGFIEYNCYTSDFDTNVPLMGMSIDVFHLMGKQVWISGKSVSIFAGINESLSFSSLISQAVGAHFILDEAQTICL